MNPERWQKLDDLFHSALEREPGEREAFINEACGGDDALRRELESMLDHHRQAESFIELPAYVVSAETLLDDDADSLSGKAVGQYGLVSELGAGGMGVVYLAFDNKLRRQVALKFLHSHLTGDLRRVQRFRQEARAASALNHPNILTIFEVGEVDGRQFIATEFVEGETLHDLMKRRRLSLREALDIAIQMASALAVAHRAGIIHRDIKPDNVMVRPDGYIKIVDFGIAKLVESRAPNEDGTTIVQTEEGAAVGTVRYMSPEQVRALDLDARTDIWSLGVVLYEMLTGVLPFEGQTSGDLIVNILKANPAPLTRHVHTAPAELERLTAKALAKDRTERHDAMEELLGDLRDLTTRLDSGKRMPTIRNRKLRVVGLGVVVFTLLVLIVAGVKLLSRPDLKADLAGLRRRPLAINVYLATR
jgi:serine/threonine protein kinase